VSDLLAIVTCPDYNSPRGQGALHGYEEGFADVFFDETDTQILFDITGSTGVPQSLTDTVTYAETIAPDQYGLLVGDALHRDVLSYDSTPAPAALLPFGFGGLASLRRKKR
jgi:hypothetical protein